MSDRKVIAVVGATGAQDGGLVQASLNDLNGGFAARVLTRDVNGAQARAKLGYGLSEEEGEAFWLFGMLATIKISGDDTAGQSCLIEAEVPPGAGSPWHVHHDEDEWFYVRDGEFTLYVGDARLTLTAGGFAFGPKGVPHTFIAGPDGGKMLFGVGAKFEGLLREIGEPAPEHVLPPPLKSPPDMAKLSAIAGRWAYGILGPPGPPPGH
jgi:quercetin dioxygenase-like cupin family protein